MGKLQMNRANQYDVVKSIPFLWFLRCKKTIKFKH